jgi:uncharacterized DUF497 family protein
MGFRWNDWNVEHIQEHGVEPEEAEEVILCAEEPYPSYCGEGKWLVWGSSAGGRLLQVIFIIDKQDSVYVIHARPLTEREKARYRRRRRR